MRTTKTILIALLTLAIFVFIVGAAIIFRIKHEAIPQYKGNLVVPGLGSDVTVYRDERGMPHIYATNDHDLYFSVCYVTAQERLWFMDLIRRATPISLAIWVGIWLNIIWLQTSFTTSYRRKLVLKRLPN